MSVMRLLLTVVFILTYLSCRDGQGEDHAYSEKIDFNKEVASDVVMTYTDSAKLQFKIVTPRLETYREDDKLVEEYPLGLEIDFYDDDKNVISSIRSSYAKRISKDGVMILRDSVQLVNALGDQLITRGITWNENDHTLETNKFVELIKVSTRDTFFGFGFYAKDDFSRFRINNMKGKRRYQNLTEEFTSEE